ncbi:enoyl-CoA hydratase-related protein [Streptomyces sp. NPDC087512]|uniref:enoyl-CoA hydratase-related protein n=1 Tax=Streptomyces sp. NPDC087512 TaxID=3155059 RepID=UPI003449B2F2
MSHVPTIRLGRDDTGVVTLVLDDPARSANTLHEAFAADLTRVAGQLETERESVRGIILTSAKKTFFAGGDLDHLGGAGPEDAAELLAFTLRVKRALRRIETLGVPVVAALGGAALGGGYEIALACHHRVALDTPATLTGLPEVTLGLLPAGGGVTRAVRLFGVREALSGLLLTGRRYTPREALEAGLVHELAATPEELTERARAFIDAHPVSRQPWDTPGHRIPGGTPADPGLAAVLPSLTATLRGATGGAPCPAPRNILAAAVEGSQVDFETAQVVESRYFVELVTGQTAKNMIQAFFRDVRTVNARHRRQVLAPGALAFGPFGTPPVAVDTSPGFFAAPLAARLVDRFAEEGAAMAAEGVSPVSARRAAEGAGYPAGAVALWHGHGAGASPGRTRKAEARAQAGLTLGDLQERLLFGQALEALRCLEDGVVGSVAEANLGSLFGAGYPGWTGGAIQYINGYPGGPAGFAARCEKLTGRYGERFRPPRLLLETVSEGGEKATIRG